MNNIKIYYGISDDIPLTIDNLNELLINLDDLLANGLLLELTTDDLYSVIAIDKDAGIKLSTLKQYGFELEKKKVTTKSHIIYYGEEPSTDTATIVCNFVEK